MGQSFKMTTEPTIWALRKNTRKVQNDAAPTLYEHIYGYDPIQVVRNVVTDGSPEEEEAVRKGSAENPGLNILAPATNFLVMELTSDEPSNA